MGLLPSKGKGQKQTLSNSKQNTQITDIKKVGRDASYAASVMSNKSDTPAQKKALQREAKAFAAAQLASEGRVDAPDRSLPEKKAKAKPSSRRRTTKPKDENKSHVEKNTQGKTRSHSQ